jgi:hypothetical protein
LSIFGNTQKDPPRPKRTQLKTTTLRKFDGGWNVIDHELNLTPRHARVFDNCVRGPDGSVAVRYGYRLWADLHQGVETTFVINGSVQTVQVGTRQLKFTVTGHGLANSNHVRFPTVTGSVGGIDLAALSNTVASVRVVDGNNFIITAPTVATSLASTSVNVTGTKDTHLAGGDGIDAIYFNGYLVVATEAGELIRINPQAGAQRIWDINLAFALSGNPDGWAKTTTAAFNMFGGKLLVHNGVDKPLEVDYNNNPVVLYLGDPGAGGSNDAVPIGAFAATVSEYVILGGKPVRPRELSISAHLIQGVWTGNANPEDAVDIDMSKISGSMDGVIMGVGEFRGRAIVAFRDVVSIGALGDRTSTTTGGVTTEIHEPHFKDNVAQHGTVSHRTMVSLGNDFFMCDHIGVPSLAQAQILDQIVPDRVSELVDPAIQVNISRLSDDTLQTKCFAVYNARDYQYMLFMPKYDPTDVRDLPTDPFIVDAEVGNDRFILTVPEHNFEPGDLLTIAGGVAVGPNLASQYNGSRRIISVVDSNRVIIAGTGTYTTNVTGGGTAVTVQPISEESIGYIFSYNQKLKIKAWSRFRGLDFDWGARSVQGRMFFGKHGKVYEFGTPEFPIYGDEEGVYDYIGWSTSFHYAEGDRVFDAPSNTIYLSLEDHTSSASGSIQQEINSFPDRWETYKGVPIEFDWEWPWGDFDARMNVKALRAIQMDVAGKAQFEAQVFVDNIYRDPLTGEVTPVRSIKFTGSEAGGFGLGAQPYGGGRRLKEQPYWAFPIEGKLHKIRFKGAITDPLRFIAVTMVYHQGGLKR